MKQYLLIVALLASICVSAQVKSGFVIGYSPSIKSSAGAGVLWNDGKKPDVSDLEWKYLYGLNLGYQFQVPLSKSFFLDASILGKMQMGSLKSGFGINDGEYY